jgi:hypothetical protein
VFGLMLPGPRWILRNEAGCWSLRLAENCGLIQAQPITSFRAQSRRCGCIGGPRNEAKLPNRLLTCAALFQAEQCVEGFVEGAFVSGLIAEK